MRQSSDHDENRWARPLRGGTSRGELLLKRHVIRQAVRAWLDAEDFVEIDAPLLVRGTTPDAAIESFAVGDRYLSTSTEFQIKRLAAGGLERIYTLTQNFRQGDLGPLNNPEFTMLEWARVGAALDVIERDAEAFVLRAARSVGWDDAVDFNGHRIDLQSPWRRLTVRDALSQSTGETLDDFGLASLQRAARRLSIDFTAATAEDPAFIFSVLISRVQSTLGFDKPVFLCDWPAFQTSSAPIKAGQDVSERSELIIGGIELADGFPSLIDHDRQQQAFNEQLRRRAANGQPNVALDHCYLGMLARGLPAGAGMALGFDRLVMVLTGQTEIAPVLAFAWDEL